MRSDDDSCHCGGECTAVVPDLTRRGFLTAALLATTCFSSGEASAAVRRPPHMPSTRALSVVNVRTEEAWSGVYWRNGRKVPEAYAALTRLFRDVRADRAGHLDIRLLDVMWRVANRLDTAYPWRILSAYRTDRTHDAIKRTNRTAAQRSFHTEGRAVDVALVDRSASAIAAAARRESVGGIGLYRRRGFVHLDTGPSREWSR